MPGEKILIVDDDDDVIFSIASLLEYKGFEVIAVHDGDLAIHKVFESKPDLIILDVMMPQMNGFNVCRTFKAGNSTRGIPIIILTAKHTGNEAQEASDAKADCYISKPFDNRDLLDKINKLLEKKKTA